MSLLKQKKENDRIIAEAAAKAELSAKAKAAARAKAKAARRAKAMAEVEQRKLTIHPVVNEHYGRDICDAYFHGLVFAAIADDEKVDPEELDILNGVAKSMNLSEGDVDDAVALIAKMSVDDKLRLIEECVRAIKEHESISKLFYAQFAELWMTGEYDLGELKDYAGMFKSWSGVELPPVRMKDIKVVVSNSAELNSALGDLAAWMGDDALKYFVMKRYGDVTWRIEESRKCKREAEELAKRKESAEKALHALQSEVANDSAGWKRVHYEWIAKIKQRMSVSEVELIDFGKEADEALNGYWFRWGGTLGASIYRKEIKKGKRGVALGNVRCVYQADSFCSMAEGRRKLGMLVVLIACKYDVQGKPYEHWCELDDMFKRADQIRVNHKEVLKQFVKREFGVDCEIRYSD